MGISPLSRDSPGERGDLQGHGDAVYAEAISPHGRTLA